MAEATETPVTSAAVPATVAVTPAVSTPSAENTPVVETPPAATTAAEPAVVADPSKVEIPVESVLGDVKPTEKKPDVATPEKKDDAKPEGDKAAPVETPAEVKVELPIYEPFKLPENVNLDKEPMEAFAKILGEIEIGKLDHAGIQETGQKLVDLAMKATTDSINRLNDYYVQIHEGNKKARLEALKADPDLGGDHFENTVSTLQSAISEYGGTEAQISEFRKEVVESGLDASPALCRLLFNMQQKINKYTTEADNGNGGANRIVPGSKPAPSKVKDYQRFYQGGAS